LIGSPARTLVVAAVVLALGQAAGAQRPEDWRARVRARVLQDVSRQGTARVIIRLRAGFIPEGQLGPAVRTAQRRTIADAGDRVLTDVQRGRTLRGLKRFQTVPYLAAEVDATELERLASHPDVEEVVEDVAHPPALAQSTALVGVPAAVSRGDTGSGWTVAVLDTGVDRNHAFLAGKVVSEACYSSTFSGWTSLCPLGVNSTAPGSAAPCASGCEHGTHVAGIAVGRGGAFSGVARDATLIGINVFSRRTSDGAMAAWDSDLMLALQRVYALRGTFNIAAVNMSLGGGLFSAACDSDSLKPLIDQLRSVSIATVVASGNNGSASQLSSPGCISTAISVGSVGDGSGGTTARAVSAFSNSASFLNLLAPGSVINSSVPGGGFANSQGTSMATPHVAGAWAVIKSRRPAATVSEVLSLLSRTGSPVLDPRNGITKPMIDLDAATADTCTISLGASNASVGTGATSGSLSVFGPGDCSWTAAADVPWITIMSGSSGTGNGTVTFEIAANTGVQRAGGIVVAGLRFNVSQDAAIAGSTLEDLPGAPVLVWHNTRSGALEAWRTPGGDLSEIISLDPNRMDDPAWNLAGAVDFNGDRQRDLLWHNLDDGSLVVWLMNGERRTQTRSLTPNRMPDANWQIAAVGDMNSDGNSDLVWQHETDGRIKVWFMSGLTRASEGAFSPSRIANTNWKIVGLIDGNDDGQLDLLWQHLTDGWLYVSFLSGTTQTASEYLIPSRVSDHDWRVVATVDSDGDGRRDDLVWQHKDTGHLNVWRMQDRRMITETPMVPDGRSAGWRLPGARYQPRQTAPDFNGDGRGDFLLRNRSGGQLEAWLMNGSMRRDTVNVGDPVPDTAWQVAAIADFNADGSPDVLWQHIDGFLNVWLMRSGRFLESIDLDPNQEPDSGWRVATAYDANGDGRPDLLWQNRLTGAMRFWYMDGLTRASVGGLTRDRSNDPGWRISGTGDVNQDGKLDLIWWHPIDGWITAWYMNGASVIEQVSFTPDRVSDTNWQPVGVTDMNADGLPDLVWQYRLTGDIQVWFLFGGQLLDSAWTSPITSGTGAYVVGVR
jgi:subtilisin